MSKMATPGSIALPLAVCQRETAMRKDTSDWDLNGCLSMLIDSGEEYRAAGTRANKTIAAWTPLHHAAISLQTFPHLRPVLARLLAGRRILQAEECFWGNRAADCSISGR